MASAEIDSFVSKFKTLQYAGKKAILTLETKNGEAFVTLKAEVGFLPPPFPPRVHRPPAYLRRQERRKAARKVAESVHTVQAEQAEFDQEINDAATEVVIVAEQAVVPDADVSSTDKKDSTEKVCDTFECEICDFKSNWENGLRIHMSRKHSRIDQLDGQCDENVDDESYQGSNHYWMKGWLGRAYQSYLDAEDTLKKCDLSEADKDVEMAKLLEARKTALGSSYMDFPPWK